MNMSKSRDIQAKMPSPKVIYASNESKFVLARDLATVAIIKIDPLDQLLICLVTKEKHQMQDSDAFFMKEHTGGIIYENTYR